MTALAPVRAVAARVISLREGCQGAVKIHVDVTQQNLHGELRVEKTVNLESGAEVTSQGDAAVVEIVHHLHPQPDIDKSLVTSRRRRPRDTVGNGRGRATNVLQ